MQERVWGNEYRTTMICVDSYQDKVPVGHFHNSALQGAVPFHSLSELLIKMEDMLDEFQLPQSFTVTRSFAPQAEVVKEYDPEVGNRGGKLCTFSVRIMFRQNASWQGSVTWLEGKREESFRSVLELLLLMDSAMENA